MKYLAKEIFEALSILENRGYEAYVVGGATRDFLLNKKLYDIDINTNASSNTITQLFNSYPTYDIGKNLGTISVLLKKYKLDITPFRKEGKYTNHRKPDSISYTSSLIEDLKRRDFTINALCLNSKMEIIDYFGGLNDLNEGVIKAIGNPNDRFYEDALRILRAIRFKAQLNFKIDEKTKDALFTNKNLLKEISNERKKDELIKTLSFNNSYSVINEYSEIFKVFINFKYVDKNIDLFNNSFYKIAYCIDKEEYNNLKKLTFSKSEINLIKVLNEVKNIDIEDDYQFISFLSEGIYQNEVLDFLEQRYQVKLKERLKKLSKYIVTTNSLKISGLELMNYGFEGKEIAAIKNKLVNLIHHQKLKNTSLDIKKYLSSK